MWRCSIRIFTLYDRAYQNLTMEEHYENYQGKGLQGHEQKGGKYYFSADYYEAGLCAGTGDRFHAGGCL